MAFIKVCPEYAKHIDFYATKQGWSVHFQKGKSEVIPLYHLKDGREFSEKSGPIHLPRVGEYRIKTMVKSLTPHFICSWYNVSVPGFSLLSFNWEHFPAEPQAKMCTERVFCHLPECTAGILAGAYDFEDVKITSVVVTVEHLDT